MKKHLNNKEIKNIDVKKIIISLSIIIIVLFVVFFVKAKFEDISSNKKSEEKVVLADLEKIRTEAEIQAIINKMSLEEKIAQLFIITPETLSNGQETTTANKGMDEAIEMYPVGGLIFFSNNIESPEQIKIMISNIQKYSLERSKIPMFISIDEEGGEVSRIAKNSLFNVKQFDKLSSIKNAETAYELGDTIGKYLKEYGFNLNYAPIADVYTNPENLVVRYRAFSSNPLEVADYVVEEIKGLKNNQIINSLKHFPGHGHTINDSHYGYAVTYKTIEELRLCEFIPFSKGISEGAEIVMLAHVSVPIIIGDNTPSSLSEVMIKDILRNELGFEGVVITDGLNMEAITNQYSSKEATLVALKAGVDLFLMPEDFQEAYSSLLMSVNNGEISQERIDESLTRIIRLKKNKLDW